MRSLNLAAEDCFSVVYYCDTLVFVFTFVNLFVYFIFVLHLLYLAFVHCASCDRQRFHRVSYFTEYVGSSLGMPVFGIIKISLILVTRFIIMASGGENC